MLTLVGIRVSLPSKAGDVFAYTMGPHGTGLRVGGTPGDRERLRPVNAECVPAAGSITSIAGAWLAGGSMVSEYDANVTGAAARATT